VGGERPSGTGRARGAGIGTAEDPHTKITGVASEGDYDGAVTLSNERRACAGASKVNRNKLVVFWSRREQDFLIRFPRSADGHLAYGMFCGDRLRRAPGENPPWDFDLSFVKELERRGYDLTTLRFSIERKPTDEAQED
jgi:hypothetical protein